MDRPSPADGVDAADVNAADRYAQLLTSGSTERILAFSDGVFAIAMTLLALELRVPETEPDRLPTALVALIPSYLIFVLSFVVVGAVWMSHHRKFRVIVRGNQMLQRLNLLMLLLVASLALPTAVLGRYGDQAVAVVLYAATVAALGASLIAIWIYAWNRGLVDPRVDAATFRFVLARSLPIPVTFLLSIPVALVIGAQAGEYTWLVALPVLLALTRLGRRRAPARSVKDPS